MADIKISALTPTTSAKDTDVLIINENNTDTKNITVLDFKMGMLKANNAQPEEVLTWDGTDFAWGKDMLATGGTFKSANGGTRDNPLVSWVRKDTPVPNNSLRRLDCEYGFYIDGTDQDPDGGNAGRGRLAFTEVLYADQGNVYNGKDIYSVVRDGNQGDGVDTSNRKYDFIFEEDTSVTFKGSVNLPDGAVGYGDDDVEALLNSRSLDDTDQYKLLSWDGTTYDWTRSVRANSPQGGSVNNPILSLSRDSTPLPNNTSRTPSCEYGFYIDGGTNDVTTNKPGRGRLGLSEVLHADDDDNIYGGKDILSIVRDGNQGNNVGTENRKYKVIFEDDTDVEFKGSVTGLPNNGGSGYGDDDVDAHLRLTVANNDDILSWDNSNKRYTWIKSPKDLLNSVNLSNTDDYKYLMWNGSDYEWTRDIRAVSNSGGSGTSPILSWGKNKGNYANRTQTIWGVSVDSSGGMKLNQGYSTTGGIEAAETAITIERGELGGETLYRFDMPRASLEIAGYDNEDNPALKWGNNTNKGVLWSGPSNDDANIGTKKGNNATIKHVKMDSKFNILTPSTFSVDPVQVVTVTDRTSVDHSVNDVDVDIIADKIDDLIPTFVTDNSTSVGSYDLIGDEVEDVDDEFVSRFEDGTMGIKYNKLTIALIAAFKSERSKRLELEARVAALETP